MKLGRFISVSATLLASLSRAYAQDFTPPVPRSELERLVLSPDDYRNAHVADWLKAHASDPVMIRRELSAIGFKPVMPIRVECEAYAYTAVIGRKQEELRARIELCRDKEPLVMLLRGFFQDMQAPGPNSTTMSIPLPPPMSPPAHPAPPK